MEVERVADLQRNGEVVVDAGQREGDAANRLPSPGGLGRYRRWGSVGPAEARGGGEVED